MSKYDPLQEALRRRTDDEWVATFAEIEAILGFTLPTSAAVHRTWWANHGGVMVHQKAWLAAGWRVAGLDRDAGRVRFVRAGAAMPRPPEVTPGAWAVVMPRVDQRAAAAARRHAAPAELSVRIDWVHHGAAIRDGRSWRCPVVAAAPGLMRLHIFRHGLHGFLVLSSSNLSTLAQAHRSGSSNRTFHAMRTAEAVLVDYALDHHVQIAIGGTRRSADFSLTGDLALAEAVAVAHSHDAGLQLLAK